LNWGIFKRTFIENLGQYQTTNIETCGAKRKTGQRGRRLELTLQLH